MVSLGRVVAEPVGSSEVDTAKYSQSFPHKACWFTDDDGDMGSLEMSVHILQITRHYIPKHSDICSVLLQGKF
jgi:hypothetical protein